MNTGRLRLLHLRDQNDAAGEAMATEAERFARIRGSEPTRAVSSFNLFQTPPALADRMAAMLLEGLPTDARILEPSAGLGRLYQALRGQGHTGPVTLVEQAADCCRELYQQTEGEPNAKLIQSDFLACDTDRLGGLFDGVLMNPPFKQGRDIKHIEHARSLLKPGGRLVSLCYNGARQRAKLMPEARQWIDLPAGTFQSEGTKAAVAMLLMTA